MYEIKRQSGRKAVQPQQYPKMRTSVYELASNVQLARPDHECSPSFAAKIVKFRFARPIGRNTIQLTIEQSWQWVKTQVRILISGIYPTFPKTYEHHIEPRIQPLTIDNSPWMKYLNGY